MLKMHGRISREQKTENGRGCHVNERSKDMGVVLSHKKLVHSKKTGAGEPNLALLLMESKPTIRIDKKLNLHATAKRCAEKFHVKIQTMTLVVATLSNLPSTSSFRTNRPMATCWNAFGFTKPSSNRGFF